MQKRTIMFLATCFLISLSASSGLKISIQNVGGERKADGKTGIPVL